MTRSAIAWLALGLAALAPGIAVAHPLNLSYLQLQVELDGRVVVTLDVPSGSEVSAADVLATLAVLANGAPCATVSRPTTSVALLCPPTPITTLRVAIPGLQDKAAALQIIGKAQYSGEVQVFNLDLERPDVDLHWDLSPRLQRFVLMGVRHIGAWPSEWHNAEGFHLPSGIDHILFLFALLLGSGTLRRTLLMVTGFTLGHSVTLALATFGVAHVPSRLVESAIALSILYVAVEDLVQTSSQWPKHRWQVATFFGLVHGLAFASALTELHLPRAAMAKALVGFNVGVELGQASLVLVIALLLYVIQKIIRPTPRTKRLATQATAIAIAIPATYWFIQRALF